MQNVMGILFCDHAEFNIKSEVWRRCSVSESQVQTAKRLTEAIGLELIDFDGLHGRIIAADQEWMRVTLWSKRWRDRQRF